MVWRRACFVYETEILADVYRATSLFRASHVSLTPVLLSDHPRVIGL